MNIQHTDTDKNQETPPRNSASRHTEDTVQSEKVSPGESFPQPPRRPTRSRRDRLFVIAAVIIVLVLILSVGAIVISQRPAAQITPTPTVPATTVIPTPGGGDTTPTPAPGVIWGPQPGPAALSDPSYWDRFLGIQGTDAKVEHVYFANVLGNPSLQALVTVRHSNVNRTLDVHVFDKITNTKPTQIFRLQALVKGDAKISGYNTILTAEVDQNSTINAGKSSAQWTQDIFREFEWNGSKGTLVQVAFPGIFPDLTRYQAEADQISVNQGHQPWKNDPAQVAKALAVQFLQWNRTLTTTVTSGGGANDVYATVKVQEQGLQGQSVGPFINVTLSRLEGNTHNLWVAISVTDAQALTIQNIVARSQIANPVKIEGKGSAFEGVIGKAYILDHLYNDIGHAQVTSTPGVGMGNATYSTPVLYSPTFHKGVQEGIVEVQAANGGISDEPYSAVMVKVLLTPEPSVTLGPLPGPDQLLDPAYWVPIIGVDTNNASVGRPSFANMMGNTSLQALVSVYHTDGSQIADVYVYDKITTAHPVQLFKLQGLYRGGAMISGYSTILTAQVDQNSSVNKDKHGDQLTTDLYREFQWNGKSGSFVQIVFPGMFPDLTRWQAEVAQNNIALQQDTWKLDAMKTAQKFVVQFMPTAPSNPPAKLQLVSGGGAHDLTAQINAAFPYETYLGPTTKLTLKRLEGNVHGIWEVTAVQADWMYISSPQSGTSTHISNPLTVSGYGPQFESQVGTVYILDHLYTPIGKAFGMGSAGFGDGPFTVKVPYQASFQAGAQEGIVELLHTGGASFDIGVVMVKVLVNP